MARGFLSIVNQMSRASSRLARMQEAEERRIERETIRIQRQSEKDRKFQDKLEKQNYIEDRIFETEEENRNLNNQIDKLRGLIEFSLKQRHKIDFNSLRRNDNFRQTPAPAVLLNNPFTKPKINDYMSKVRTPNFFEKLFNLNLRYQQEIAEAENSYNDARAKYEIAERKRKEDLEKFLASQEEAKGAFELEVQQHNQEIDDFFKSYQEGDIQTIISYNSIVLTNSEYPDGFPQEFKIAYTTDSKQLVIDYDLPNLDIIPKESEYRYIKAKDSIESKPRKASEIKELFQDIVSSIALRTIHEIFEADQGGHIDAIVFNGFVHATDPSTGQPIYPCILSVRTTKTTFSDINLAKVDKRVCLRSLGAQVSNQPQALQPVKPIVEFNMVDKRFVDQGDIIGELDSRPNLMELNPFEFETLVSNLFGKMGLETKLTRTSKDGGVDAVAYDLRPVIGGKVVIQAKRYKNTVGVSAVRDLYGTMLNEGANKGILVATSGYGPDAFEFAKDKPIELIDGGGLLYLLEQVGIKAKIIIPDELKL